MPAFIGYTEKAEISGQPVYLKPVKISSLADYTEIFGFAYQPTYDIVAVTVDGDINAGKYDFKVIDQSDPDVPKPAYYRLKQQGTTQFNLYQSLKLFYANGGGNAYVVSVGRYSPDDNKVEKQPLLDGLAAVADISGPTMLVVPDAVLLPPTDPDKGPAWVSGDFQAVVDAMLKQAGSLQDRVAILDVYGSLSATDQTTLDQIIAQFRTDVGSENLSYGMGYFPFLDTSVVDATDYSYDNIAETSRPILMQILGWQDYSLYRADGIVTDGNRYTEDVYSDTSFRRICADIAKIAAEWASTDGGKTSNRNLLGALPLLGDILSIIADKASILPSSGAIAGVFTTVDNSRGVWNAPANIAVSNVNGPTYRLTDQQQGDLNVPVDGKAVDAIRDFVGRGTIVWGARTLDGNSNDYRYIQVRRTLIYIEQSIKAALQPCVFAANDGNTWTAVVAMVSNFLQGLWAQGGLMGAKADEAFSVQCGLGSTMTGLDILNGYMVVQVTVQMIHPAEFIELTFKQKMEGVA
ncbi:phage tail sheath C-terminal domain-containing protein [uncultured Thiodictyon sp.]|uniref:phage tail sheath family protein n=1 Tax=uncultured Thiodictyon sp. TaxID=1846217 RepID=UPI0025DD0CBE|nr:phage tail sheath C-terminal domain-containing protein [uncultured Thiodictyon sp.]